MTAEDYAKLSTIAPTIAQSGQYTDYFEPWYVQSAAIGTAVGKKAEVTELVAGVRQQFADAAAAHPEFAGVPADLPAERRSTTAASSRIKRV